MKSIATKLLILLCFCCTQNLSAQTLIGTDVLNFDFFRYNFSDGSYDDLRISTGFPSFDIYYSVTHDPSDNHLYVSLLKYPNNDSQIIKYNYSNQTYEVIVSTGIDEPRSLTIAPNAGKLYWVDPGLQRMKRANLDGSNIEDLGEVDDFLTGWEPVVVVDENSNKIYYTEGGAFVLETEIDNWNPSNVPTDFTIAGGRVGDVAVEGDYLYWSYNATQEPSFIARRNLITGAEEKIVTGADNSESFLFMSTFAGRLYWTATGSILSSVLLDGTDRRMEFDADRFVSDYVIIEGAPVSAPTLKEDIAVKVFPSLVTDWLTIEVEESSLLDEKIQLMVIDASGKLLSTQEMKAAEPFQYNTTHLSSGIYFILLQKEGRIIYQDKFVKGQ